MKPFAKVPLKSRSLMQQLFGQHPQENAIIEVNNLLAKGDILDVHESHLDEIGQQYKVDVLQIFPLNLEEFYAVYLNHSLQDFVLGESQSDRLKHMKQLFTLNDQQITSLHQKIGKSIYAKSLKQAIADGNLSGDEQRVLENLKADLQLADDTVKGIESQVKGEYMQAYIDSMIANQLISPTEEQKLEQLARNLNVTVSMNAQTRKVFDMMKRYWALEHLDLPVQLHDVLQKGEVCYVSVHDVAMYDTPTSQRMYGRDLNTAQSIYIKDVSNMTQRYSGKKTFVATGTLYLTNKRIFFDGLDKNSYIKFDKIMSISAFSGGVRINKEGGKIPYFEFSEQLDVFCVVLERILRESNQATI